MHSVLSVAHKEFRDSFRNRWVLAVTVLFSVLALGLAYFGAAAAGRVGFKSFNETIASLTTLAAFVIPLIGLLIAYDTIVGERDGGTLLLLLSYPLSRVELLVGKFIGHSAVLSTATVVGFGIAVGVIQALSPETRGVTAWIHIGGFMASASLLGISFAGMACIMSVVTRDKSRAAGVALLTWFTLVIVFDLVLLAVLVASGGNETEQAVFPYLLLFNPIDVFRLTNLLPLGAGSGNAVFMGMTGGHSYHLWLLWGVLAIWSVLPFIGALYVFHKQEV